MHASLVRSAWGFAFVVASCAPPSPSGDPVLAEFEAEADLDALTLRVRASAGEAELALTAVRIVQDGAPGVGPVGSAELVTEGAPARLANGCPPLAAYAADVTLRSFYATPLGDAWVEITAISPGFEACNSDPPPPGLSDRRGLWAYGFLPASGGEATREWRFRLPRDVTFSFKGRALAERCLGPATTAPVADPGGPYTLPLGATLTLDGRGSFDPDAPCDAVVAWAWDTDNDALYGLEDTNGSSLCGPRDCAGARIEGLSNPDWRIGRSYRVGLRVEDSVGLTSAVAETLLSITP